MTCFVIWLPKKTLLTSIFLSISITFQILLFAHSQICSLDRKLTFDAAAGGWDTFIWGQDRENRGELFPKPHSDLGAGVAGRVQTFSACAA